MGVSQKAGEPHLQGFPSNVDDSGYQSFCNHPLGFTMADGAQQKGRSTQRIHAVDRWFRVFSLRLGKLKSVR